MIICWLFTPFLSFSLRVYPIIFKPRPQTPVCLEEFRVKSRFLLYFLSKTPWEICAFRKICPNRPRSHRSRWYLSIFRFGSHLHWGLVVLFRGRPQYGLWIFRGEVRPVCCYSKTSLSWIKTSYIVRFYCVNSYTFPFRFPLFLSSRSCHGSWFFRKDLYSR